MVPCLLSLLSHCTPSRRGGRDGGGVGGGRSGEGRVGGGPRTSERPAQNQQAESLGLRVTHSCLHLRPRPGEESCGRGCVTLGVADKPRDDRSLADRQWGFRRLASVVWLQHLGSEYLTRLLRGLKSDSEP